MCKKCSYFGDKDLYYIAANKLKKIIIELIEKRNVKTFYVSEINDNNLFYITLRMLKYYHNEIKIIFVKSNFSENIVRSEKDYDSVVMPDRLADLSRKNDIMTNHKWIIDNSDIIISCVYGNYGDAYDAIKYAESQNKEIVNIFRIK